MSLPPVVWRIRYFGAASLLSLVLSISSASASLSFVEDFSAMDNGSGQGATLRDGNTRDWASRGFETWVVEEQEGRRVLKSLSGLAGWHALGRPHGFSLGEAHVVDIYMTITQLKSHSANWLWLSDNQQNGYGVEYSGVTRNLRIFKLCNNETPFGPSRDTAKWSQEIAKTGTDAIKIAEPVEEGSIVTIWLRLEQAKGGEPVKLSAWAVSDSAGITGSADGPIVSVIDDGSGGIFSTDQGKGSPVIDLSSLTHLALSASNNKDGGQPVFHAVGLEVSPGSSGSAPKK